MNKILFDIISPHWEYNEDAFDKSYVNKRYVTIAQTSIIIDGKDLQKEFEHMGKPRFVGISPEAFLYKREPYKSRNKTNKLEGTILIGICNACFFSGCDDLFLEISTENNIVKWVVYLDRIRDRIKEYFFDINDYNKEIANLYKKFHTYEWEDKNLKIIRLCDKYVKGYKTKNANNIEGVRIFSMLDEDGNDSDKLSNEMEIYCYNDHETVQKVEWDGETLESALKNLKTYAEQNLVKIQ